MALFKLYLQCLRNKNVDLSQILYFCAFLMAPPKRKLVSRSSIPPDGTPPPTQPHTTTLSDLAESIYARLTIQESSAIYASSPTLNQDIEFQMSKGCDVLVCRDTHSEYILRGVFKIARNDFYFTPDGGYDPDNPFHTKFKDVKLNCRLTAPGPGPF
jgi:hypothetical protein